MIWPRYATAYERNQVQLKEKESSSLGRSALGTTPPGRTGNTRHQVPWSRKTAHGFPHQSNANRKGEHIISYIAVSRYRLTSTKWLRPISRPFFGPGNAFLIDPNFNAIAGGPRYYFSHPQQERNRFLYFSIPDLALSQFLLLPSICLFFSVIREVINIAC